MPTKDESKKDSHRNEEGDKHTEEEREQDFDLDDEDIEDVIRKAQEHGKKKRKGGE